MNENFISMVCPECHGRIFDTNTLSEKPININLKCPHCGMIVTVGLNEKYVRRKPPRKNNFSRG